MNRCECVLLRAKRSASGLLLLWLPRRAVQPVRTTNASYCMRMYLRAVMASYDVEQGRGATVHDAEPVRRRR